MSEPEDVTFTEGSGNVFADLDLEDADELQARAQISFLIRALLRKRKLTQVQAAHLLGIDQPKVSALVRGRMVGFSLERLLGYLTALGQDVEITVKPAEMSRSHGRVRVVAAARG